MPCNRDDPGDLNRLATRNLETAPTLSCRVVTSQNADPPTVSRSFGIYWQRILLWPYATLFRISNENAAVAVETLLASLDDGEARQGRLLRCSGDFKRPLQARSKSNVSASSPALNSRFSS